MQLLFSTSVIIFFHFPLSTLRNMLTRALCRQSRGCVKHATTSRSHSALQAILGDGNNEGIVINSRSENVFENLALEDWIHDNIDLQNRKILYLWRNNPTVVIGRHQNPWQECNLKLMREIGMPLARRRSGGGTVYHDLGNINMTFFTSKKNYDRYRNLSVVTNALKTLRPNLDVKATDRYDILLNGHLKISGTAAKLGRTSAYHHCTLLCSANRSLLSSVLKSPSQGIKSNATPSVPSAVQNLFDEDPTLDTDIITTALAHQYNMEFGFNGPIYDVDPSNEDYWPGIRGMAHELQTWEWVYGRTPKFTMCTDITVNNSSQSVNATLNLNIKNGLIESCSIDVPTNCLPGHIIEDFCSFVKGSKFCPNELVALTAAFLRTTHMSPDSSSKLHDICEKVVANM